jgi:hypothetical protein
MKTLIKHLGKHRRNFSLVFVALCIMATLAGIVGCSSVQSAYLPPGSNPNTTDWDNSDSDREGFAYFLPIGRIHIVANRNEMLVTNYGVISLPYYTNTDGSILCVTNSVTKFQIITNIFINTIYSATNFDTQQFAPFITYSNASNTGFTNSYSTNFAVAATKGGPAPPTPPGTNFQNAITTGGLNSTIISSNALLLAYPTTSSNISETITTITLEQPIVTTNFTYSVTVSTDYRADRKQLFFLHPQLDGFHDDVGNFVVDNNGLLSTVNVSNNDQSGNIIVQLANAAIQSFEMVASGGLSAGVGYSPPSPSEVNELQNESTVTAADFNFKKLINTTLEKQLLKTIKPGDLILMDDDIINGYDTFEDDLTNSLNNLILDPDAIKIEDFRKRKISLSPETEILAQLIKSNPELAGLKPVLHRKMLEDAFPHFLQPDKINWWQYIVPKINNMAPPKLIDISFDPFNTNELSSAITTLSLAHLAIENTNDFTNPSISGIYSKWTNPPTHNADGIYYRPPMPYEVRLRDGNSNVVSSTVLLPNRSPLLHLDLKKALFVQSVSQVTLTNGFISSYALSKPSSVLALASLPVQILSGITSSMTNLIQLKFNLATAQNNLQTAALTQQSNQLAAVNNQIAILTAQQKFAALKNSSTTH